MTNIEEKDDYIEWLENLCCIFLGNKNIQKEKIIKKIKENECFDDRFVEYFIDKMNKTKEVNQKVKEIIETLPLLKNYPIDLLADNIFQEDEKAVFKWEKESIKKLLVDFDKKIRKYGNICVSVEQYGDFFDKEIYPYKEWLFSDIYDRCKPEKIAHFWGIRKDRKKSWTDDNIVISITSILESDYLDVDVPLERFNYLIGKED